MDLLAASPLRAATLVFQPRAGAFALTVVCKATLRLTPGQATLRVDGSVSADLQTRSQRLGRTLALRAEPLRILHAQQISLLRRWRGALKSGDESTANAVMPELLLTINAIARAAEALAAHEEKPR